MLTRVQLHLRQTPFSKMFFETSSKLFVHYGGPIFLVIQNSLVLFGLRFLRHRYGQFKFAKTSMVFMIELLKCVMSFAIFAFCSKSWTQFRQTVVQLNLVSVLAIKSIVPALTYCVQNVLLLIAIGNLNVPVFQATFQLKIFTTAVFLRLMLKKRFSVLQWLMLAQLFAGVCVVQLSNLKSESHLQAENPAAGVLAAVSACVLSGFNGVYTEKLLKNTENVSLWARNFHLAFYGSVASAATMVLQDLDQIRANGLTAGYHGLVWIIVLGQAIGGLLVAVVIATHDNVIKGFTNAASLILSTILAIIYLDASSNAIFCLGMLLVLTSIPVYLNADDIVRWLKRWRNNDDDGQLIAIQQSGNVLGSNK